MKNWKVICVVSGGMDSATLLYMYHQAKDAKVEAVSFNYGQRHSIELECAALLADNLGVRHDVVDLRSVGNLLSGSALTDSKVDVPEGHYSEETMAQTVVPNRNMIMLSIATGIAVAREADIIATGVHMGDHAVYPDCRPQFIDAMNMTVRVATEGFSKPGFKIEAPFIGMSKADIAKLGHDLSVPYELTWSCYKGEEFHCGRCGTCVERIEAFHLAGVPDPTHYQDKEFWKSVTANA